MGSRDRLFARFVGGLFALLMLYGAGMVAVILWGEAVIATRLITGFSTMFAGLLGLGSGYLLARRDGDDDDKG